LKSKEISNHYQLPIKTREKLMNSHTIMPYFDNSPQKQYLPVFKSKSNTKIGGIIPKI
jgi:hypothetical protein